MVAAAAAAAALTAMHAVTAAAAVAAMTPARRNSTPRASLPAGPDGAGTPPGAAPPIQRDKRQIILDATLRKHQFRQDSLIEALHTAQGLWGFLTPELLWYVAQQLRLPPSKVYGVATFYNFFTLKPAGLHSLVICQGTACYINGAPKLAIAMRDAFGIDSGETTPDNQLSIVSARCLGSCGLAPAAVLDGTVLSRLTPETIVAQTRAALEVPPATDGAGPAANAVAAGAN
jgi:bidirectional [NiFe] hydrogenase diaphorase subunit